MDVASPPVVASLLKRERDAVLAQWEAAARELLPARGLSAQPLRNHVPLLVDELIKRLEQGMTGAPMSLEPFSAHGEHRLATGMSLSQLLDDYKLLRQAIVSCLERVGVTMGSDTARLVHGLLDDGLKASVQSYVDQREAQENKRREEYLTFIVHDLRSPLSAIYYAILLTERELEQSSASERLRNIQSTIKRNIERMQALIVKLMQEEENVRFAKNVQPQRSVASLWPIVDAAVRALNPLATASSTTVTNHVPADLMIYADPELLERVFQNLLADAIEHTPGGTVTIGAQARADGSVDCWVADNGKGIAEEAVAQLEERSGATSRRTGPVDRGLAVVKQIVEAHSGDIRCDNRAGAGTTYRFSVSAY